MANEHANVVIIGGGCIGTSAAYHLCKAGVEGVVLVEREFLASGSTGRCAGGMRQQWATRGNVILAKHSMAAFRNFQQELGQDIDFVQGGYLLTGYTAEMMEEFARHVKVQNSLGVNTRLVSPREVREIAPLLNTEGMLGAAYGPTDGLANPFLVVEGYARRAREMGCRILTRTTVVGLEKGPGRLMAVLTDRGRISANWVILAAGAYSSQIAAMAGVSVPIRPYRHQILVTEPLERCHDPMVIDLHHNLYFSQDKHGSFLTGQTDKDEPAGLSIAEKWRSGVQIARKLVSLMPALAGVNVLRHWAGLYEVTPDAQPIIGRLGGCENFLIASGFSGHGFMLSPISGRLLSEIVVHGKTLTVDIADYSVDRFSGTYQIETNVV